MKIHTPIFIIGLLVFLTPFLGLTALIEMFVISAFGIAIMIISSTINPLKDSGLPASDEAEMASEEEAPVVEVEEVAEVVETAMGTAEEEVQDEKEVAEDKESEEVTEDVTEESDDDDEK
jgi:hypothetical protein